jgi:hypothetical protein
MDNAALQQRRRRQRQLSPSSGLRGQRELYRPLNWCLNKCSNILDGYCHYVYPGCRRHDLRRAVKEANVDVDDNTQEEPEEEMLAAVVKDTFGRHLQQEPHWLSQSCQVDIAAINATLDSAELQQNITTECQALINAPRNLTCLALDNCEIEHFFLAHIDTRNITVPIYPENDGEICRTNGRFRFAFGVRATFCVDYVQFTMHGVSNNYYFRRTDYRAPFLMFPSSANIIRADDKVAAGNYTLTAVAGTDQSTAKTIHFTVKDC